MVRDAMRIPIDRRQPASLARQIQAHLEGLIQRRVLTPGLKLPATRELARELGVNRATVAVAYEELVAAGWASAHVGQGTFVAARPGASPPDPAEGHDADPRTERADIDWSGLLSKNAQIIAGDLDRRRLAAQATGGSSGVISFAGGMPDSAFFPTEDFRRVLNRVVREEGSRLLQYYSVSGYQPLRRFLSTHLLRHGVEARAEQILIVNGSQQGFDLIARTLLDPGDLVAVEQPTYPRAIQAFRSFGAQLLPVPLGSEGPQPSLLARTFERYSPKFFYCQPTGHNPTGLTIGLEARHRILEIAARYQVPLVEDGFDSSLYYGQRPAAPLKALDRHGLVIYIGTFSKVLFPGLRLGWLVAPPAVRESLEAAKQLADIHTSALIQAAVCHFCERRLLERHVARIAREYGRRRAVLLAALRRRMRSGVSWTEPQGGFSLLVTLPESLDATALLARAVDHGVAFTPGAAFFVEGGGARTLRLSFSAVPVARIDEGIRRLAEIIDAAQSRRQARHPRERETVPLV